MTQKHWWMTTTDETFTDLENLAETKHKMKNVEKKKTKAKVPMPVVRGDGAEVPKDRLQDSFVLTQLTCAENGEVNFM